MPEGAATDLLQTVAAIAGVVLAAVTIAAAIIAGAMRIGRWQIGAEITKVLTNGITTRLVTLEAQLTDMRARDDRIETKVDRLLERGEG